MDLRSERRSWTLIYLCLGVVEGGTAAVMVRSLFGAAVAGIAVDLVLAVVSAASVCVGALALLPVGGAGLVAFLLLYGAARVLWAGVDTVRSVVWSVNYPRHLRARVTGRIMVNGAIALSAAGLLLGWLLAQPGPWYRIALVAASAAGIAGSFEFRRMRVRQEQRLLEHERERLRQGLRFDLRGVRQLLAADLRFRRYMLAMSVFGAGHLMLTPLLVVCMDDVLGAPEIVQVAVTAALPVLVMPVAIQPWARFLDRHHVIVFRSVHAWVAVAGAALLAGAVLAALPALLWPGALLMGISLAAGSLGWSLGHNDFAPRGEETRYMALHVTLTGLRGLLAPPVAILAYHGLRRLHPGVETWVLVVPVALIVAGAWLFTSMRRSWGDVASAS